MKLGKAGVVGKMLRAYATIIYANYLECSGIEKPLHISDNIYYPLIGCASETAVITTANIYEALILIYGHDLI